MKYQDYYETLGVARDAPQAEIKKAYRRLSKQFHPDRNKEKGAEDAFKKVGEAYQVIGDPDQRAKYDNLGRNFRHGQDFTPPNNWQGVNFDFDGAFAGRDAGPVGFSDFFEALFGQTRAGAGARDPRDPFAAARGAGRGQKRAPWPPAEGRAGDDRDAEIEITLEDAHRGATRKVNLTTTTTGPDGGRVSEKKSYDVKIPAGTTDGTKIRLKGQGAPGLGGGQSGNLMLRVKILPHPRFVVDEHDLKATLKVSPWEAALGAKVPFTTLDGDVTLTIPAGTQSGRKLRLRERGLPTKSGRGDLHVEINIVVPATLTDDEKRLFEELGKLSAFDPRG